MKIERELRFAGFATSKNATAVCVPREKDDGLKAAATTASNFTAAITSCDTAVMRLSDGDSEELPELGAAFQGDAQHARVAHGKQPAQFSEALVHRTTQRACDVVAALGPVEAAANEILLRDGGRRKFNLLRDGGRWHFNL